MGGGLRGGRSRLSRRVEGGGRTGWEKPRGGWILPRLSETSCQMPLSLSLSLPLSLSLSLSPSLSQSLNLNLNLTRTIFHREYDLPRGIGTCPSEIALTAPMPWGRIVSIMITHLDWIVVCRRRQISTSSVSPNLSDFLWLFLFLAFSLYLALSPSRFLSLSGGDTSAHLPPPDLQTKSPREQAFSSELTSFIAKVRTHVLCFWIMTASWANTGVPRS